MFLQQAGVSVPHLAMRPRAARSESQACLLQTILVLATEARVYEDSALPWSTCQSGSLSKGLRTNSTSAPSPSTCRATARGRSTRCGCDDTSIEVMDAQTTSRSLGSKAC